MYPLVVWMMWSVQIYGLFDNKVIWTKENVSSDCKIWMLPKKEFPEPPCSWLGFTAFGLFPQSLWCNLDCKILKSFIPDLLSLILDVSGIFCCTAASALIPHSKLTLAQCRENRGKALKCDGPDSFRRNSQRAWLERFLPSTSDKYFGSKGKEQTEAVSLYTQTFEISNSFACCF